MIIIPILFTAVWSASLRHSVLDRSSATYDEFEDPMQSLLATSHSHGSIKFLEEGADLRKLSELASQTFTAVGVAEEGRLYRAPQRSWPTLYKAWVWGNTPPHAFHAVVAGEKIPTPLPDHGYIGLEVSGTTLTVKDFQRPPRWLYPRSTRFCSTLLPAAIHTFFTEAKLDIRILTQADVWIDTHPDIYFWACRCVLTTFVDMGLTSVGFHGETSVRKPEEIDEYCEVDSPVLIAGPSGSKPARLPRVREDDLTSLAMAQYKRNEPL